MCRENVIITASVPIELASAAKEYARRNGDSFSELIRKALFEKIGFKGVLPAMPHGGVRAGSGAKKGQGNGGDLSRFKTPETHARVCAKMREARAKKLKQATSSIESDKTPQLGDAPFSREQLCALEKMIDGILAQKREGKERDAGQ